MSTMITEVYDALITAGAREDKARAAATVIAESRHEISDLGSDIKLLKWITGFNLAFAVATLTLLIRLIAAPGV